MKSRPLKIAFTSLMSLTLFSLSSRSVLAGQPEPDLVGPARDMKNDSSNELSQDRNQELSDLLMSRSPEALKLLRQMSDVADKINENLDLQEATNRVDQGRATADDIDLISRHIPGNGNITRDDLFKLEAGENGLYPQLDQLNQEMLTLAKKYAALKNKTLKMSASAALDILLSKEDETFSSKLSLKKISRNSRVMTRVMIRAKLDYILKALNDVRTNRPKTGYSGPDLINTAIKSLKYLEPITTKAKDDEGEQQNAKRTFHYAEFSKLNFGEGESMTKMKIPPREKTSPSDLVKKLKELFSSHSELETLDPSLKKLDPSKIPDNLNE